MRKIVSSLLLATAVVLAGPESRADEYPPSSAWSTFWGAFFDQLTGESSDAELHEKAQFAEAGIRFDYPAVLRGQRDEARDCWRLWRGDAELEICRIDWDESESPEQVAQHTIETLATLQEILSKGDPLPPPSVQQTVPWCGQTVAGVAMRARLLGDLHDFLEFKLRLGRGKGVSLSFEDIAVDGKSSRTREATLAMVKGSLVCVEEKPLPGPALAMVGAGQVDVDATAVPARHH